MSATFKLLIITPEGAIFQEQVRSVSVPGQEGSFGLLSRHAPIVAKLNAGVATVRQEEQERFFAVGDGILEVNHRRECLLLVDYARAVSSKSEAQTFVQDVN